jgi:hypothetical protein
MSPLWQLGNAIEFHYMDGESEFRLEESSVLEALLKEQRRSMKKLLILAALLVLLRLSAMRLRFVDTSGRTVHT